MVTQLQAPKGAAMDVDSGAVDQSTITVEANTGLRIVFKVRLVFLLSDTGATQLNMD